MNLIFVVHIPLNVFFVLSTIYLLCYVLVERFETTITTGKEEGRKITGAITGSPLG